ncbi:MAG: tetratricopeptide repeat protein [Proteobacteria bacterium]|nr:tetratricopeptide repeat protein [Desulfobacula sp.]MBU0973783.1 tetratricopeptide repeat protein [Pseudomonadota bacterium]
MSEEKVSNVTYITKQKALFIGLIGVFIGFVFGVWYTTYKLDRNSSADTQTPQSIDYTKKIKNLLAQIANSPNDVSTWTQLGHAYYDTEQFAKAIDVYIKSLSLKPDNPDVLTDLGIMYRRSNQPDMAIESFDKAIRIDPKHESSRFNKGIVLMNDLKEREKALETWEKLLEINPIFMSSKDQSLDQLIKHYKEH